MSDSLPLSVQLRIEEVCTRFEDAWKAAGPTAAAPPIENYLGATEGPERSALLRELLRLDLHYRGQRGEVPWAGDYEARFPEDAEAIRALLAALPAVPNSPGRVAPAGEADRATMRPGPAAETVADPGRTVAAEALARAGAAKSAYPTIPGYEVLGVLGRGGMGVVYKARQTALKRLAALKMILSGDYASPQELARFRTEAEAVARLQHPNIVQVFEVGEHDGRPFFSLEYVGGGTLAAKLRESLPDPKEAAALVERLARAVHAVHQCDVVHRDLKPANVLLTADGTPKITDFGLAKKLDEEAGQTHAGAVMGTASYMAREQASGATAQVGPLADVYALGAILYECLTGRPPFKAATVYETLRQVREDEPVAPRTLNPAVPRDLETVCLKCLRKEPGHRYASAAALAEDLRRWQAGEPVAARPVGRAEWAAKWVRRNPVVAALVAAVVLALLGGIGVSTGFGIAERQQAEKAKTSEADAVTKGQKLEAANKTLTQTVNDLERTRDDLVTGLARSVLRTLTSQDGDPPMTEQEWDAVWDLATNRRGRLGYRFVEEASRTPATSRQLRARAALALPAAVGLDAERRAEVEGLLLARLDDPALDDEQKTDLALATARWDGLGSAGAVRTARPLARAMTDTRDPNALRPLAAGLSAAAARLEAKDAAQVAAALLQALKDAKDPNARQELARALSLVAARLEARDAAQAAAALLQALKDAKDPDARQELARALSLVADRLEAGDAAQAAAALLQALKDAKDPNALRPLAGGLSAVAARLDAKDAAQAAAALLQALKDAKDFAARNSLAPALSAVAARLEAKNLAQALKDARDPAALQPLAWALSAVAPRLEARDAAQAATALAQAMTDAKDPRALESLAQGLSALLSAVPPADIPSRSAMAASAVAFPAGTGHPLTAVASLLPAAEPPPCRLSTQQLVELLKMPPFVGEARRIVLDQLGNRYRRTFGDVWEFVAYAQQHLPDVDLSSPPKRPSR
jgi:tRNA A-37 threonylcarbamoyl transferase component Bud32/cell division protein FtsB